MPAHKGIPQSRPTTPRSVKSAAYPLGKLLSTSKSNPFGCPLCVRSQRWGEHRLQVFENGVRFSCGCIVDLPPLHRTEFDHSTCTFCYPHLATVRGLRRKLVA